MRPLVILLVSVTLLATAAVLSAETARWTLSQTTAWLALHLPHTMINLKSRLVLIQHERYEFFGCKMHVTDRELIAQTHGADTDPDRYYGIEISRVPPVQDRLYSVFEQKEFKPMGLPANRVGLEYDFTIDLQNIEALARHLKAGDETEIMVAPRLLQITASDPDLAYRAAQAINHAAHLCRAIQANPAKVTSARGATRLF